MNKLNLNKLTAWLEDIFEITYDVHVSYKNTERLFNQKYQEENKIKELGFFRHYQAQLNFVMVIQLAKLLSHSGNQKRNLNKLCDCLANEKYDETLNQRLRENSENVLFRTNIGNSRDFKLWESKADIKLTVNDIKAGLQDLKPIITKI